MTTRLPATRFRQAQWLIAASLVVLLAVVVLEVQALLGLGRAAEEQARRHAQLAARLAAGRLAAQPAATAPEEPGWAVLSAGHVVEQGGLAGPVQPAWWPWTSAADWERAGRPVAGPLPFAGRAVVVAYEPLGDGRAVRVVLPVTASALNRSGIVGALLALVAALGGGVLALVLLGRVLAPYRDLLSEARRLGERPRDTAEDSFLIETFRQAIERLQASEATLRERADELAVLAEVLSRGSEAGVVISDADGTVRAANLPAEELLGRRLGAGQPLPAMLAAEGRVEAGQRWLEVRRVPLLAASGASLGDVRFVADRTRVEALERALAEREQMASLGELSAGLAHELRNALATVKGYLRLLPKADAEGQARYLGAVEQEAAAVTELLDRFLRFAQPSELRRERVELGALAEEVADRVRASCPGATVAVSGEATASGDRLALAAVLENLVRNAAEAAAGCVKVTIEAQSDAARVVIDDDGAGVAAEVRDRLFAPFVSTKPSGGLGLALARRLARLHGGDVVHEERPGGGARFVLSLPEAAP